MDTSIREQVSTLLQARDYDHLVGLCLENKRAWKTLRMYLYSTNENLCWPAIEAIAKVVQRWWLAGDEEKVRVYIRNLFWSLNDESGGIGWNAPQTIAEIIVLIPELTDPYASMMIDRTLEESLLTKSGLWGIGRLGKHAETALEVFQDTILKSLTNDDPQIVGLAAWALGKVGTTLALPWIEPLTNRQEPVRIYVDGDFHEKPLGQWAQEAIDRLTSL